MNPERQQDKSFRQTFFLAYGLGTVMCVVWPLILQFLLGRVIQPGLLGMTSAAEDLGYTFTGLVALSALYVTRRAKTARAGLAAQAEAKRPRRMAMEILLYSALFESSALFGLIYHGLGGPQAERYARTFIALATIMFLLFVPRLAAWQKALEPRAPE